MPIPTDETGRLRDLHDSYVWKVNAAVGEGRDDLVRQLCDEYLSEAMAIMGGVRPAAPAAPAAAAVPWRRRLRRPRTFRRRAPGQRRGARGER